MDWDDIRIFKAVIDHGSYSRAGKAVSLSQPSVGRRMRRLQERLGVALFERGETGLELTRDGRALQHLADEMADRAHAFHIAVQALGALRQSVRVACSPMLAMALSHRMPSITEGLADVDIALLSSTEFVSLEKGEADIAIRNKLPKSGHLIARSTGTSRFGIYCAHGFAEDHAAAIADDRLADCAWVGFAEVLRHLPSSRWLAETYGVVSPGLQFDNSLLIVNAVRNGRGLAVLPTYVGSLEGLFTVRAPLPDLVFESWIVSHADSVRNPAIVAVKERLVRVLKNLPGR
jgi:DNA-binding transcriptional LysR family regulator